MTGQDTERGAFTQCHAVLSEQIAGERYTPLASLVDGQASFEIVNALLSEEAVLAFEYGYALAEPHALVLWEAQFDDFANGAQVVFDQFLASGERKWHRMPESVCLLPHGFDGQGSEHSSARLSATCRARRKITGRSRTVRRQRTTSIFCGARFGETSESP